MIIRKEVSVDHLVLLRNKGIISQQEVAYWSGDILIAENVLSSEKRIIENASQFLSEASNKKLLKG